VSENARIIAPLPGVWQILQRRTCGRPWVWGRRNSGIVAGLVAAAAVMLFSGCASDGRGERGGSGLGGAARPVERLDLLLTSVGLNLDGKPGADGFGARVYASSRKSSAGTPLARGKLEILMYDGVVRGDEIGSVAPLRTWSYDASELKPYVQKTSIGTGYRFVLAWGEQTPKAGRITVVARYTGPDGMPVYAAPGNIPLTLR
jgi:hypothetical protein